MYVLAQIPDGFQIVYNLTVAFSYFIRFLRYFIIVVSLLWTVFAILNLYSVASAQNGQPSKFLPTRSQPTAGGAWLQLVIAGMTFIFAKEFIPASVMSALLTGTSDYVELYSVPEAFTEPQTSEQTFALVRGLVHSALQFMGILAWFRGYLIWYNIAQGTSDKTAGKVLGYFVFGTACFAMEWINELLSNTIGFDFFQMFFGN